MLSRSLGHRAPLLWLAVPLAVGLIGAKLFPGFSLRYLAAILLVLAISTLWITTTRATQLARVGVLLTMIAAGYFYLGVTDPPLGRWELMPPREIEIVLRIQRLYARADTGRLAGVGKVLAAKTPGEDLIGRQIYFVVPTPHDSDAILRSAEISVSGVLNVVPRTAGLETFDGYLLNSGIHFRLSRGRLREIINPPSRYRRTLDRIARRMDVILHAGIPPRVADLGNIYRAMMLGKKYELSEDQDTLFVQSGTMHLFAINGLHIGVVAIALQALWTILRLPRSAGAVLTLAVLWLDVQTTGASPSSVRAFFLVACYEFAFVFRLRASGIAALAAAALLILLAEPFALFSASFQMSYGAVVAILLYGLPLAERWETSWSPFIWLPKANWTWAQNKIAATWRGFCAAGATGGAAALTGAVTATQYYHTLAPGGLLTNLLLVPMATFAIIAGFISILCGSVGLLALSGLFNRAALVILWVVQHLLQQIVKLPAMWWTAHWRADWIAPFTLVLLLAAICFGYSRHWERRCGGFWVPPLIVACALLAGIRLG